MKKYTYTAFLLVVLILPVRSQITGNERFVQLSGIITDYLSQPVQGVAVVSKKLQRASISERTGIYSITTTPGDTVFFRAIGYKRYHTVIPESYDERHCKADIRLEIDTISIEEVTILPWRTYSEFLADVTKERPKDPVVEYMNENLASIYVAIANDAATGISPEAGYKYAMEQNFSAMSTRNMFPVNNLLNPFAWAKFVSEIKNGLLRNKSYNKPEPAKVAKKRKKPKRN
ncbi:MAG TPA: hypothetical protein PLV06_00990 [Bacteroidales bacterium]|nr:hypothetical protein [Bacteroidales bacterium]HPF03912.1 hypothetical protein [Bacteroidales bacterium]HPJ59620.1 hypothetical protein [Bacteroidales bacterium]HPR10933.1 hypothetical protein [Bacteroidales bacterium]HRW84106.1 hypothetical protein [Bacteroidales bacterium]